MSERFMIIRSSLLLLLTVMVLIVWSPAISFLSSSDDYLTVRFLDVGQGDSINIETPDGYELLIDGGPTSIVLRKLAEDRSFFDKKIDVVMATHPDADHISGLVDVFKRFDVGMVVESGVESDSSAARAYTRAALNEGVKIIFAQAGQIIQLGASTTVRILSPYGDVTNWQNNNASVVVQVVYGETEFMLTGDAPVNIEDYLVSKYETSLESEVLKLGHHGSKTSTSELFLDTVIPEYAIVSSEENSRYGHPHHEVIEKVEDRDIKILNTAENGTIIFKSDGKKVWLE